MERFYLGVHRPDWLGKTEVPLFVCASTLRRRKSFPRARGPWVKDSGGFMQLQITGEWQITPKQFVAETRLWSQEIGRMEWAAPMDWMCEPTVRSKTGLSVVEHQRLTVENFLDLNEIAPDIPWKPVLQGWSQDDFLRCVDLYDLAGVDLRLWKPVGLGTVCRRQHTPEIAQIATRLSGLGLKLHGFGVKKSGILAAAGAFCSTDSMSWSYQARREFAPAFPACAHKNCANCLRYALRWRLRLLRSVRRDVS